jgi:hypothetical protein
MQKLRIHKFKPAHAPVEQTKNSEYKASIDKSDFWDKADRIAVMTAGGAALGGAIAMVPGAVALGLFAGAYGYYIGFVKPKSV